MPSHPGEVLDGEPNAPAASSPNRPLAVLRRWWPVLRVVLGIALAGLALWVLAGHRDELQGLSSVFDHLRWWWIPPAFVFEMASLVAFGGMQYDLLAAGGLRAPVSPLVRMTFASQAINNSLPGGTAIAAVYGFRWYRRFGADAALAAWALSGTVVIASVSLALVAAGGLALAADQGASLDLIPVVVGVLLITVAVLALFIYERPLAYVVRRSVILSRRVTGRPRGDLAASIDRLVAAMTAVRIGWRQLVSTLVWGLANWLCDCTCFALMFLAIGSTIPWKGLLLAYGAGQLAATLPITPGGLGAVEGSITIALVAFGGAHVVTVDAVLMYRLISFWLVLVIGWVMGGELALEVRRGRWIRQALDSPVEAALVPGVAERDPAPSEVVRTGVAE